LPLHLDIGCGKGGYLLTMARHNPQQNFLGLEIRRPLVVRACQERDAAGLTNLHYAYCNVNVSLGTWEFQAIAVSILFPDPWFKRRQQKRRTVQPQLVADLARILVPGGQVYLQSDVEPLAIAMVKTFLAHPAYRNLAAPGRFLGDAYPDHVPTEREQSVRERGLPIYQTVLVRD
jgi:tRNA (guanine-N7-)-methyltransferase